MRGHIDPKTWREERPSVRERKRELALAPLFICLSLPGPVLCKLGQPGVLFVSPEVLTQLLGPPFVSFSCFIFTGFSLPCLVATAVLDSFPLSYLPNTLQVGKLPHCLALQGLCQLLQSGRDGTGGWGPSFLPFKEVSTLLLLSPPDPSHPEHYVPKDISAGLSYPCISSYQEVSKTEHLTRKSCFSPVSLSIPFLFFPSGDRL